MIVQGAYSTSVSQAGSEKICCRSSTISRSASSAASAHARPMLSAFVPQPQGLARFELRAGAAIPGESIWLDLLEPTPSEEKQVESFSLDRRANARRDARDRASNRLYEEDGALYMTATVVTKLDSDLPESTQITFIVSSAKLVTNRYVDPLPFRRFIAYAERHPNSCNSPPAVLAGLVEAIDQPRRRRHRTRGHGPGRRVRGGVQRLAPQARRFRDFRKTLERLGRTANSSPRHARVWSAWAPADLRAAEHRSAHVRRCPRRFRTCRATCWP
jgi:magnesium transporter